MRYFEKKIGNNGANATFYLQEPNIEIDIERKSPVMVVVPGGAYMWTSWREKEPIALDFLGKGFSCVVADYATEGLEFYGKEQKYERDSVSAFPKPLVDLAKIIAYIREHAEEWNLDAESINIVGFSAGGNLTAQLGAYWNTDWLEQIVNKDRALYKPDSICLAYGATQMSPEKELTANKNAHKTKEMGNSNKIEWATLGLDTSMERKEKVNLVNAVTDDYPKTFIWHTMEDPYVPVAGAIKFASELEKTGVPFEMHIYQKGKHGLGLADLRTDSKKDRSQSNKQAATWVDLYVGWLEENGLVNLF